MILTNGNYTQKWIAMCICYQVTVPAGFTRVQHLMETRRLTFSERPLIDVLSIKLCTNFTKKY